jgi:hypothetical protein
MSGTAPARYPRWWGGSLLTAVRAGSMHRDQTARTPVLGRSWQEKTAELMARMWRQLGLHGLVRPTARHEPRTSQELFAYARSLESSMPNLAAELRYLACKEG